MYKLKKSIQRLYTSEIPSAKYRTQQLLFPKSKQYNKNIWLAIPTAIVVMVILLLSISDVVDKDPISSALATSIERTFTLESTNLYHRTFIYQEFNTKIDPLYQDTVTQYDVWTMNHNIRLDKRFSIKNHNFESLDSLLLIEEDNLSCQAISSTNKKNHFECSSIIESTNITEIQNVAQRIADPKRVYDEVFLTGFTLYEHLKDNKPIIIEEISYNTTPAQRIKFKLTQNERQYFDDDWYYVEYIIDKERQLIIEYNIYSKNNDLLTTMIFTTNTILDDSQQKILFSATSWREEITKIYNQEIKP